MKTSLKIFVLLLLLWSCEQKAPPVRHRMPVTKEKNIAVENPKESGPVTIYSPPTVITETPEKVEKVAYHPHGDSVLGIWQATKESYHQGNDNGNPWTLGIWPAILKYDGSYITSSFPYLSSTPYPKWNSKDGYYKMKAVWRQDTLGYLTPFGDWQKFGVFKNGLFTSTLTVQDSVYTISFKKITAAEVPDFERAIFKPRKPHNYALK